MDFLRYLLLAELFSWRGLLIFWIGGGLGAALSGMSPIGFLVGVLVMYALLRFKPWRLIKRGSASDSPGPDGPDA